MRPDHAVTGVLGATIETFPAKPRSRGLAYDRGITAAALVKADFPPIRYIVNGILAEGLTVFAGSPKIGKSWMMLGIAIAIAEGGVALNKISCAQGDVLYLALEDNRRRLKARLIQLARAGTAPERLTFIDEWPDLDDEGCLAELDRWIEESKAPRLIIVDVFAKVRGQARRNEMTYEADYRFASAFQKLASKHGIAIVLVHHTRKMEAEDPFDSVSGTRGLTGAADTVLVLKRDPSGQHAVLYGRGRDVQEFESAVQLDRRHGFWSLMGDAAEIASTRERQSILDVLRSADAAMSLSQVVDAVGKSPSNTTHLLKRLMKEGKVEKTGRGQYSLVPLSTHSTRSTWKDDANELNEFIDLNGG